MHENFSGEYQLKVTALTWSKQSHSLFDYQSANIKINAYKFLTNNCSYNVFRKKKGNEVVIYTNGKELEEKEKQFEKIASYSFQLKNERKFPAIIFSTSDCDFFSSSPAVQSPFLIIRSIKNLKKQQQGFRLRAGNIVKFGRVQYYVLEIKQGQNISKSGRNYLKSRENYICKGNQDEKVRKQCRICLQSETKINDFFVNPCKCTGSCTYVHFSCLKQWVEMKVRSIFRKGVREYDYNQLKCQLCRFILPTTITYQQKIYQLLPVQKPSSSYIIFEPLSLQARKLIILDEISEEGVKIGRGSECIIRVSDISVSRIHAYIKKVNGAFLLFDNSSKFGTLVRNEQSLQINLGLVGRGAQIGRTALRFQFIRQKKTQQPISE